METSAIASQDAVAELAARYAGCHVLNQLCRRTLLAFRTDSALITLHKDLAMPSATILSLLCVQQSTGTDAEVNQAFATLPEIIPFGNVAGFSILDAVKQIPGVIAIIDAARSDPDQLYMTTSTNSGRDHAIWPEPGRKVEMQAGQSESPMVAVNFGFSQNISLWDADVSDDDLMGSVTMYESELGAGVIAKKAQSLIESSCYYVTYRVD